MPRKVAFSRHARPVSFRHRPFVCLVRLGSIDAARASRLATYIFCFYHAHTIPFLNSSSGYFVPRHTMPSFQSVKNIDRSSVYTNSTVLIGCKKK